MRHGSRSIVLPASLLLLLASTAFCSGGQESTGKTSNAKDAGGPAKVVFFINNGFNADTSSNPEQLELLHRYFLDKVNVDIQIITPPVERAGEKLNLLLTSNQKVDCFWGDWQVYSGQQMIQPITDDYSKADFPGIAKEFGPYLGIMTDSKGELWGLPRTFDTAPYPFIYREDYAKAVGFDKAPSSIDELNSLLYAFKQKDPAGGGKTIPVITTSVNALAWCLLKGYTDGGNALWLDKNDGKVKMAVVQPGYRDFMDQVAKWYRDGILYKESFNINTTQLRELVTSGRAASSLEWYSSMAVALQQMYQANPTTPAVGAVTHGIRGPKGLAETAVKGSTGGALFSVRSSPETVRGALRVINLELADTTTWYNVTYGIDRWKFLPGSTEAAEAIKFDGNVGSDVYKGEYRVAIGKLRINEFKELLAKDERYLKSAGHTAGIFFYWLYNEQLYAPVEKVFQPFDFRRSFDSAKVGKEVFALADINRMIEEELVKFATGVRPLTEWDDFITTLYKIGMGQVEEAYTTQYKATK